MKTNKFLILSIAFLLAMGSCKKEEQFEVPEPVVVAAFETLKEYYEIGEPISFINQSENAKAYLWTFGENNFSSEENPVYIPEIKSFLGIRFRAHLAAIGEDGTVKETEQIITASRRIFRKIIITELSDVLLQSIKYEDGKKTQLMFLVGPAHAPIKWFNSYSTLIPANLPAALQLPFEYSDFMSKVIAMDNGLWIINIYSAVEGQQEPRVLHSFEFEPTQQEPIKINGKVHQFNLTHPEIRLVIEFEYV